MSLRALSSSIELGAWANVLISHYLSKLTLEKKSEGTSGMSGVLSKLIYVLNVIAFDLRALDECFVNNRNLTIRNE